MATFFDPKKEIENFDKKSANILADAVTSARLNRRLPNREKWAKEFEKLRTIHDKKTIEKVLEWYVKHLREPYIPKTLSGQSFRLRFEELLDLYEKSGNTLHIEGETRLIAAQLGNLEWPWIVKKDELTFIQICLTNHRSFLKKIQKAADENKLPKTFALHIKAACGDTRSFVSDWVRDIHKMTWTWREWNGDLLSYALDIRSFKFQAKLRQWCSQYWGPGDHLNRVFDAIDEN